MWTKKWFPQPELPTSFCCVSSNQRVESVSQNSIENVMMDDSLSSSWSLIASNSTASRQRKRRFSPHSKRKHRSNQARRDSADSSSQESIMGKTGGVAAVLANALWQTTTAQGLSASVDIENKRYSSFPVNVVNPVWQEKSSYYDPYAAFAILDNNNLLSQMEQTPQLTTANNSSLMTRLNASTYAIASTNTATAANTLLAAITANSSTALLEDSGGGGSGALDGIGVVSMNGGNGSAAINATGLETDWLDDTLLVLKASVMLFIIIAAIFGNLLVIISVMRVRKLR